MLAIQKSLIETGDLVANEDKDGPAFISNLDDSRHNSNNRDNRDNNHVNLMHVDDDHLKHRYSNSRETAVSELTTSTACLNSNGFASSTNPQSKPTHKSEK